MNFLKFIVLTICVQLYEISNAESIEEKFSFRVNLLMENSTDSLICKGSFITPKNILTSAQCLKNYTTATITSLSSSLNLKVNSTTFFINPEYLNSLQNDLGLITLSSPVNISSLIDIPTVKDALKDIKEMNQCLCENDQCLAQEIIPKCSCNYAYNATNLIKNSNICVNVTEGIDDDCSGRLGEGLILNTNENCVIVGILSHCEKGMPKIYTKVSSFLSWIRYRTGL